MNTEERIAALERSLEATQGDYLVHISELNHRMATLNKVISGQELNNREIDHNLTILLGVASGQERDIQTMKADLGVVKADLGVVKEHVERIDQRFEGLDKKVERIDQRFEGLEKKFDTMLNMLAAQTRQRDQET